MIVRWNGKGLKVIPTFTKTKIKKTLRLLPGVNEINDEDFKGIEKSIASDIENKRIEILTDSKDGKIKNIDDFEPNKAEVIISDTYNLETLKSWKLSSNNDEIRLLLANKIDEIEKFNKDPKKKG